VAARAADRVAYKDAQNNAPDAQAVALRPGGRESVSLLRLA